jgi:branched-subunit amino acid aminotransferase/4-amino-4-deoxychorismate lyase
MAAALAGPSLLAYLDGRWLPLREAAVSVLDGGFVQGTTVAEQLRTFRGRLFELPAHLARLAQSLAIIGLTPPQPLEEIGHIATELAEQNAKLLEPDDDQNVTIFVTPGPYPAYADVAGRRGPTLGIHTQPLPFWQWAEKYETGERLIVSEVRQVPAACWPSELKCRSRMHYYLADRQARQRDARARALLLNERGLVTEASTANVLLVRRGEGLVSPRKDDILPGVTMAVVASLARRLGMPWVERDVTVADVVSAEEVLLCSTSPCVLPVAFVDGRPIGEGVPGPVWRQLIAAFSEQVGLDIIAQARQQAARRAAQSQG